jgi:hypothetical protein
MIIWLLGALIAIIFPKDIMRLGYKTMSVPFDDEGKEFFDGDSILYIFMIFLLSWISVIGIYCSTVIYIFIHKHLLR